MKLPQQKSLIIASNQTIIINDLLAQNQDAYDLAISVSAGSTLTLNETIDSLAPCAIQKLTLNVHEKSTLTYICRLKSPSEKFSLNKSIKLCMLGKQARIDCLIYCHGKAHQQLTLSIEQEHGVDLGTSNVTVKTLLDNHAQSSCSGIIKVAGQTNGNRATLTMKTMVLSDTAEATATPQLEILSDDVACKHGATFETINPIDLFYMQSKGITYCQARNVLLKAFLCE